MRIFKGCVDSMNVFLALFVDDGLVASESREVLNGVISCLKSAFRITIGDASQFVSLQIERNRVEKTMFLHQSEYAEKISISKHAILEEVLSILCEADFYLNYAFIALTTGSMLH